MDLQHEWVAMQHEELSASKVDDAAYDWTRHVAGINLQYCRHDKCKSTTSKPL